MNLRETFLSHIPRSDAVTVRGTLIYVREVTGAEAMEYARRREQGASGKCLAYLISVAALAENGSALFSAEDIDLIDGLGYSAIEPVGNKIFELSGMVAKTDDEKKQTADAAAATPYGG